jgi:hypothetical protein
MRDPLMKWRGVARILGDNCAKEAVVAKNLNIRISGKLRLSVMAMSIALASATIAGSRDAGAASVSGIMSYRNGSAATKRQLHFEDRTTGDIYVAPTNPDGSFTADLPPGLYDLRGERGVIIAYKIRVDTADINVGHVVEPAPLDVLRPFQREGVADAIVVNPAPATANLGGRPLQAMRYGYEAVAPFSAPGTPAPQSTPLGEVPYAMPSSSAMMMH